MDNYFIWLHISIIFSFVFQSSDAPVPFVNWAPQEPDNWNGQEDAVHVFVDTNQWNDMSPTYRKMSSVCEKSTIGDYA